MYKKNILLLVAWVIMSTTQLFASENKMYSSKDLAALAMADVISDRCTGYNKTKEFSDDLRNAIAQHKENRKTIEKMRRAIVEIWYNNSSLEKMRFCLEGLREFGPRGSTRGGMLQPSESILKSISGMSKEQRKVLGLEGILPKESEAETRSTTEKKLKKKNVNTDFIVSLAVAEILSNSCNGVEKTKKYDRVLKNTLKNGNETRKKYAASLVAVVQYWKKSDSRAQVRLCVKALQDYGPKGKVIKGLLNADDKLRKEMSKEVREALGL